MNVLTDEKHCGFMTNPAGPFAACLKERRDLVEGLFDDCLYDSCALFGNDTLVGEQVCDSLAALWMACADADIDYRSPEMCPRSRCFTKLRI